MAATSGSPLVPSRDSRLNPDDVAQRSFSLVKRGYAENEVRAYLRLVADELASAANRARELAARVESLEARLAQPTPPPSDQDLITQLGEETARVLGQARESAVELRTKAEEHARELVKDAQENARQLVASSQQSADAKAREVEDGARTRANEIVGEARTMRDRVLADLGERRQDLERQVTELRAGRGKLVEVYQVVERALSQATRVLGDEPAASAVPGRAPVAPPAPSGTTVAPAAAAEAGDGDASSERGGDDGEEGDQPGSSGVTTRARAERPPPDPAPPSAPGPVVIVGEAVTTETVVVEAVVVEPVEAVVAPEPGEPRDVGALFDRLRSEQAPAPAAATPAGPETAPTAPEPAAEPARAADAAPASAQPAPEPEPPVEEEAEELGPDQLARRARDDALEPVRTDLSRRAKRTVQDEQNDVLDGLRRQRGKIDTAKVLPAADEQVARWAHVLQPAVDGAYEAGTVAAGATVPKRGAQVSAALLDELTAMAVTPLRSRLEASLASVDARSPADMEITIAQALGARYREWRTQDLDDVLVDVLTVAYARGVFDGAPDGARLRWVPEREGRCPDCDDNALEPTTKGEAFPTGQTAPPAHPGCRCLLVVEPAA